MVVRVTSNGSVDMFVYTDIEQFPCIFDIRICESAEHRLTNQIRYGVEQGGIRGGRGVWLGVTCKSVRVD